MPPLRQFSLTLVSFTSCLLRNPVRIPRGRCNWGEGPSVIALCRNRAHAGALCLACCLDMTWHTLWLPRGLCWRARCSQPACERAVACLTEVSFSGALPWIRAPAPSLRHLLPIPSRASALDPASSNAINPCVPPQQRHYLLHSQPRHEPFPLPFHNGSRA